MQMDSGSDLRFAVCLRVAVCPLKMCVINDSVLSVEPSQGFFSPTIDSALTSGFLRFVLCSTRDNSLSVPAGSHWQGFRINYFGRKNNCQRAAATAASTFHSHFCKFLPSLLTPYWHCMKQRAGRLPFSF